MTIIKLLPDQIFNVGKIVCVGQNYRLHIEEMKSKTTKDPVLFLKPSTALLPEGNEIILPEYSNEVHFETELALLVGKKARNINRSAWREYISGIGIALDLTLRDWQRRAKEKGHPWAVAKGFDGSCPISSFVPLRENVDIQSLSIQFYLNNELRQDANTREMIHTVDELLAYISGIFTLEEGDLVLTGTPAGVGEIRSGDKLAATISEIGTVNFIVA
jgi:5-carboxymethyl-2-hydroxymuconate isomerase